VNGGTRIASSGYGRQDLPKITPYCGVWWLDSPSRAARTT